MSSRSNTLKTSLGLVLALLVASALPASARAADDAQPATVTAASDAAPASEDKIFELWLKQGLELSSLRTKIGAARFDVVAASVLPNPQLAVAGKLLGFRRQFERPARHWSAAHGASADFRSNRRAKK